MARGKFDFLNIVKLSEEEKAHYNKLWGPGTPACFLFAEEGQKVYANHSHEWFATKACGRSYYVIKSYRRLDTDKMGWDCIQGMASTLKGVREVIGLLHAEAEAEKAAQWIW
jgi:hypothetical protein